MPTTYQSQLPFRAGDAVYTLYGAGVIVSAKPITSSVELPNIDINQDPAVEATLQITDYWYTVRLWRLPNRSVGSSALATLRSSVVCLFDITTLCSR